MHCGNHYKVKDSIILPKFVSHLLDAFFYHVLICFNLFLICFQTFCYYFGSTEPNFKFDISKSKLIFTLYDWKNTFLKIVYTFSYFKCWRKFSQRHELLYGTPGIIQLGTKSYSISKIMLITKLYAIQLYNYMQA